MRFASLLTAALLILPLTLATHQAQAESAALSIPKKLATQGTPYHALTGHGRQMNFFLHAPLEDIQGESSQIEGYAIMGPSGNPAALAGGYWRLRVDTLKTGIPLRDEHLASSDWLDAKKHPFVSFELKSVDKIFSVKTTSAFRTDNAFLHGTLTLHGVSKEVAVPATFTFMKASDATAKMAPGNLLAIRAKFVVTLKDYGVTHDLIGKRVGETVAINQTLYLSTVEVKAK